MAAIDHALDICGALILSATAGTVAWNIFIWSI